jgi:hypothetical protein
MSNTFTHLPEVKTPEVKFNKNGYEIRTEILKEAKDLVAQEFSFKWQGWEQSVQRDEKSGQIVTTVSMPEFPGLDKVLETAEKMYAFVNQGVSKK